MLVLIVFILFNIKQHWYICKVYYFYNYNLYFIHGFLFYFNSIVFNVLLKLTIIVDIITLIDNKNYIRHWNPRTNINTTRVRVLTILLHCIN